MEFKEKNNYIIVQLFPGEDVNKRLLEVCEKCNIKTAVIISGIGQLKYAKLGFFKNKGNYSPEIFDKPLEILSLTGNICKQNKEHFLHLHAVLGNEEKKAIGGHFIEGTISVTGEIIILKTDIDFSRSINKETGLKTLNLK